MTARNIAFVVVNININYRRPAVLSDLLTVTSEFLTATVKAARIKRTITLEQKGGWWPMRSSFVCIDLKTQKRCRWKANCVKSWNRWCNNFAV